MCTPTFTSSDWSTHVFVIGHITSVMLRASKIYASKGKTKTKGWGRAQIDELTYS